MDKESPKNIWEKVDFIGAATDADIINAEKRLGVIIPVILKQQLKIQNGGDILFFDWFEQATDKEFLFIGDSIVDGICSVSQWCLASENDWFSNCNDVHHKELLVSIAGHSESQLCLDYRKNGRNGEPGLTAFFVTQVSAEIDSIESITNLIHILIKFKYTHSPVE
ncbi:SMI1/KNR4 family protein [Pseudoalteromonas rhizosphaerae]|uniref:SMI1/KNR4 family protein n=1 Tax=Pseudoalteromonas rhizosphaerae TaxID=2518973 RepID=A0ABW8L3G9_9GAMM